MDYVENFLLFPVAFFENRLGFDEVTSMSLVAPFCGHGVCLYYIYIYYIYLFYHYTATSGSNSDKINKK